MFQKLFNFERFIIGEILFNTHKTGTVLNPNRHQTHESKSKRS